MSARRTTSDLTWPVVIAATVPLLLFRLGVVYLRMKAKRGRAVRTFRRALVHGGMSREMADRFAEQYASLGRLRTYVRGGFPFAMQR